MTQQLEAMKLALEKAYKEQKEVFPNASGETQEMCGFFYAAWNQAIEQAQKQEPVALREFVERVSKQKPEKPDYWSSCGQCERNISDAEDLLESSPPQRQPLTDEQAQTIQKDSDVKTALLNYSVARNDRAAIALVKAIAAHGITGEQK